MSASEHSIISALLVPLAICFTLGTDTLRTASTAPAPLVRSCAHIIPESPTVALGSRFTAYCILSETCISRYHQDAKGIFWKVKHTNVSEEQYATINTTVSSVTLNVTSLLDSFLTCNILAFGQTPYSLYGIFLTLGLPPDKPENLTCILFYDNISMCTWNPGKPTFLNTSFTLRSRWMTGASWTTLDSRLVRTRSLRNRTSGAMGGNYECKAATNNTCTIPKEKLQLYVNTEIWVEVENALGKVESDHLILDPITIVKFRPPNIHSLICVPELPNAIKIEWDNPVNFVDLKYIIRYRKNTMEWDEVPPEDTSSKKTSFTLQGLKPYTEYVVSLKCMRSDGQGFWSDWSTERSVVTTEAKPAKGPDLWREVLSESEGKRHLRLKWKELERVDANGAVLGYRIIVTRQITRSLEMYDTNNTNLDLMLTNDAYGINLTAYNSAGESPKSFLHISASNSRGLRPVKNVRAYPKDKQLWVEWTSPNASVKAYVIEWCIKSDKIPCTIQWQKEPSTSRGAFLRGDFEEMKRYTIGVYPLYSNGHGVVQSTEAYLQQGRPAKAPDIRTKKVEKYEVTLVWGPVPLDDQRGFITNYTIIYRSINRNESSVVVGPDVTEYSLSRLTGDTLYMVRMRASTEKGDTDGPELTFTTLKFAKGEIEAIVVPSCIGFLLITLLGIIFCFSNRNLIKKYIWPNIPDPSKSTIVKLSPHIPTRHNFNSKNQTYPEESFTDVSVVEITADDKKSFSEQDMKPLDLLKKEMSTSEGHSSGIGGSSGMSSPRQSVSDSEDSESAQTTSSTVQYSTVVLTGYRDQKPVLPAHSFSRSESTQPLLESEEKPDDQHVPGGSDYKLQSSQYFKQSCGQDERSVEGPQGEQSQGQMSLNKDALGHQRVLPEEELLECPTGNVSLAGGEVAGDSETIDSSSAACETKCYLPQIVRKGGYMPQ
ncbi:interleukin-6 receptor subunit beta isoform X2 [Pleurodeles waltl]|uniref:interleukin-6 receptor subunit beta isoform X2 n=1 Tax=Pleurodeles waltl TaxID=8319 RepID=UPI00370939E1